MKFTWEVADIIPGQMIQYETMKAAIATTNFNDARGDVFMLVTVEGAEIFPPQGYSVYEMVSFLNGKGAVPIKSV